MNWVSRSWDKVSEEVIIHSFKACGITLDLDGTEDHMLHETMAAALDAQDRQEAREEVAGLLFDLDSDGDSDSEFEGFGPEDIESDDSMSN